MVVSARYQNRLQAEKTAATRDAKEKKTTEIKAVQSETYNKYASYISSLAQSRVQVNNIESKIGPFDVASVTATDYSTAVNEVKERLKTEDTLEPAQKDALLTMLQEQSSQNNPDQIVSKINIATETKLHKCARVWGVQVTTDNGYCAAVIALKGSLALGRLREANDLTMNEIADEVFPNAR